MENIIKKAIDNAGTALGLKFKPTIGEQLVIDIVSKTLVKENTKILTNIDVKYLVTPEKYIMVCDTYVKIIDDKNIITKRISADCERHLTSLINEEREKRINAITAIVLERENNLLETINAAIAE